MNRLGYLIGTSALAITLGAGFEAQAQNAMLTPPPTDYSVDGRGVDLLTGRPVRNTSLVSIGQPGAGGLSYDRTYVSGAWRDNVTGTMTATGANRSILSVSIGGVTDVFTQSGTTYTPSRNVGQTLSLSGSVYTYRTSDGVEYRFSKGLADQRIGSRVNLADEARLSEIRRPNGEIISFFYEIAEEWGEVQGTPEDQKFWAIRLREVSNNFGYALRFDYQLASNPNYLTYSQWQRLQGVTAYNKAQCGAGPTSCAETWPSVTFDGGKITDQSGRVTFYGSSGTNQLVLRLPQNPTVDAVKYTTDSTLRVTSVAQGGSVWNYAYSEAGGVRTVTITDPNASVTTAQVNTTTGLLTSLKDPLNRTTSYAYDSNRRVTKVTYPALNATSYTYDARGNVTLTTATPPPSVTATPLTTSATYPASCANTVTCNLPTSTTDERGNTTNYAYDPTHGGITSITLPAPTSGAARPQTRIAYAPQTARYQNASGALVAASSSVTLPVSISECVTGASCAGAANEVKTSIVYGAANVANNLLPTTVTTGAGDGSLSATTTMTYTPNGDVASVNGPLAGTADTTLYRYDNARQLVGVVGPDPDGTGPLLRRAQRYAFNANGQVTLAEAGTVTGTSDALWAAFASLQKSATTYDTYGRPTHQRQQSGSTTHALVQKSYDTLGRVDCVTTRMNPATFASPPAACSAGTAGSFGPDRITKYGYDAASQLISTTAAVGAGDVVERAAYNANGKPVSLTDGKGNVSTLTYDGFDRLVRMNYPNPTGTGTSSTDFEEYTYDAGGNVLTYRNRGANTITMTYDALGRQTGMSGTGVPARAYTYDNLGRTTSASITGGGSMTRTWDALGRLTSETQNPLAKTVSYQYDLAGRRTRLTWPDGFFVNYDYNTVGDLTAIRENGATDWLMVAWNYDNLGRRIAQNGSNGAKSSWTYDGAGRLSQLKHDLKDTAHDLTLTFGYNPAGQIVSRTASNDIYSYSPASGTVSYANNGRNQVTSVGGSAVAYDARQNITSAPAMGTYAYDNLNQMTSATVGGTATTFAYDPAGRMSQMGTSRLLYDGAQAIGEYNSAGTLTRRHVPGAGLDEVVVTYNDATLTHRRWAMTDERGSVVALTGATAAGLNINTYDEYGQPGPGNTGFYQYTGQIWLPQAQAYHYKARVYAPQLGRFMQTDPLGYQAGANLYGYVGGDPVNATDPFGLQELISRSQCTSRGGEIIPNAERTNDGGYDFCEFTNVVPNTPTIGGSQGLLGGRSNSNESNDRCALAGRMDSLSSAVGVGSSINSILTEIAAGSGGDAARQAFGGVGVAFDIFSASAAFSSSQIRGDPLDVSIMYAGAPLLGSSIGTNLGARSLGRLGALGGPVPAVALGAAGAVGGGFVGGQIGQMSAAAYAQYRMSSSCN